MGGLWDVPDLSALNTNSLNHLHLVDVNEESSLILMELALNSSSEYLTLTVESRMEPTKRLLEHDIMKRVVNLRLLYIEEYGSFMEGTRRYFPHLYHLDHWALTPSVAQYPEGLKLYFPRLSTCEISCHPSVLTAMDLSSAKTLHFRGTPSLYIFPALDPNRLTKLIISDSYFKPVLDSTHKAPCLVALNSLEIQGTKVCGSLNQYFLLPNLKQLRLCDVGFVEGDQSSKQVNIKPLETGIFQDIGNMEVILLEKLEITEGLAASLRQCLLLQQLKISSCTTESFLLSFIECVKKDINYIPNLQSFVILDSWPDIPDMSFEKLAHYYTVERPNLQIYGNGAPPSIGPGLWHITSRKGGDRTEPFFGVVDYFDDDDDEGFYDQDDDRDFGYNSDDSRFYSW
jgi:hypothetical protein